MDQLIINLTSQITNSTQVGCLELKLVYYIKEEILDSELLEKIVWNDFINEFIEKNKQNNPNIQLLGLYGTMETVIQYLKQTTSCSIFIDDQIHQYIQKGILCITQHNKNTYLCFICPEEYFTKKVFQESAEITLYRYLKDICQNIVLLPSTKIINNWKANSNHYYQEQDSVVMEFEISQINELKLETQTIKLDLQESYYQSKVNLVKNQENLRCTLGEIQIRENTQVKEETLMNYFLQILKYQEYDINALNLERFGPKVSKILHNYLEQSKHNLNKNFQDQFNQLKQKIKAEWYNPFSSELQYNEKLLDLVTKICFQHLRQNFNIYEILQIQYNLIQSQVKQQMLQQYIYYKKQYMKELNEIIDKSINFIRRGLYHNKQGYFSIPNEFTQFRKNINKEIEAINNSQEIFLQTQIYCFYAIQSIEKSQYSTKFDTNTVQINLNNILDIGNAKNLSISYFFQIKYQYFFILKNESSDNKQYLWIQNDLSGYKIIFKIKETNQLQFHYDFLYSTLYIFNTKLGASMIQYNEDRKIIKSEKSLHLKNINLIDLAYLQYFESFILLNDKNELFQWNIYSKNLKKLDLKNNIKYQRVLTAGNGNYYCLLVNYQIDIYNYNNEQIKQIQLDQFIKWENIQINEFHLFSDQQDWYLTLLNGNNPLTIQIKHLSNQQKIVSKKQIEENSRTSNPFLDLLKGSVIKYGPCLKILPTGWDKTYLFINCQSYKVIRDYFELLDLETTDKLIDEDDSNYISRDSQVLKFSDFLFVLISRQAIQLCTIEKSLLSPLSKGLKQKQQNEIRVLDKVNMLTFGIIEKLLDQNEQYKQMKANQKQNIFIVSIMGRQSSGKSYLLNRIFGTRFGVSSARCTDGIWMSVSKIDGHLFILLDCEGLFSTRRTPEEETMLLAFLSSISDITILNQDLTFSRNLNELFQNLSKTIQQIRGEKLFKGKLMIAVRDVNQKEKDAAQKELIRNMDQIKNNQHTGNFLKLLFNDNFLSMLMSYFDNKQFDKDLLKIREVFLLNAQSVKRWDNQHQLLRSMKIMLVQIEVKDHRSLEDHEMEYTAKNMQIKAQDLWNTIDQIEISNIRFSEQKHAYNFLLEYSFNKVKNDNSTLFNNENLKFSEKMIQETLMKRNFMVLNEIKYELEESSINKEEITNIMGDIQQQLETQIHQYQICFEKCSECFLLCKLAKNHLQRDQIELKEDLSQKVTSQQYQMESLSKQIKKLIDVEKEQENIELLEVKLLQIQKQIQQKQDIYKRDQLVNDLKQLLEKTDYNDHLFACYMNEFLQSAFNINQKDLDSLIIIDQIQKSLENSIKTTEDKIKNRKEEEAQLELTIKQINLEELSNCFEKVKSQQSKLNKDIQQQQEILSQCQLKLDQITLETDDFVKKIQEILDKYKEQDVNQLSIQLKNQTILIQQRLDQIYLQINEKKDQIKIETDQEGLFNYLNQRILNNKSQIDDFDKEISDLMKEEEQNLQKKDTCQQNQQNILQQKKLPQIQQKLQEISTQIKEYSIQRQIMKQQLQYYQNILTKLNLQINNDIQFDIIQGFDLLMELVIIQDKDLFAEKENLLNQLNNNNEMINELDQILSYNIKKTNQSELQIQIETILQGINQKSIQIEKENHQLQELQQTINEQQAYGLIYNQQKDKLLLIAEQQNQELLNYQSELIRFKQNKDKLKKINFQRENINLLNVKIQQQYDSIKDKIVFESSHIEQFQVEQQSLSKQILELEELIEQTNQFIELKQDLETNYQELNNIQHYLNKQHNCGRQHHQCDQICQGCGQEMNPCKYQAGHNQNQSHLCVKQNHFCKEMCYIKNCGKNCQQQYNHDEQIQHNCLENHACAEKCPYCPNLCKQSDDNHNIHQCEKVQCSFQCYFHQNSFNDEKRCMNQCSLLHKDKHDYHICSNQAHQCFMKCQLPGTCQIATYTEKLKTWTTQNGFQFQYKMYKQNAERLQCQEKLMQHQIKHDNQHHCNQEHICDQRCPECDAFCTLKIGHQGKHQPHLHRNKEQQVFTFLIDSNQSQLFIQEEGLEDRIYQVGDSCEPETCTASCARRSRAHFHLLECKGRDQCAEIKFNNLGKRVAKHQNQKYKGSDKIYDEILCEAYWGVLGWEHPVENKQRNEINSCNFFCNACVGKEKQFCTQEAWHTTSSEYRDHSFSCQDIHNIQGVDISFVFDSTGSMTPYIQVVMDTIERLMNASKQYFKEQGKDQNSLKFSIVSYKDHDHQNIVEHIDFCDYSQAKEFLSQIQIIGGKDVPEAMFDGLQTATKLQWRPNSKKFLVLLCDSPPHGTPRYQQKYHDNYPQGCPCGSNEENTLPKISGMNIQMIALKLDQLLNQTFASFKKTMPQLIIYDQITNEQFIQNIENLVCQQLEIREITISKQ